jgi:hypothetical protein
MENTEKKEVESESSDTSDKVTFSKSELANLINQAVATHTKRLHKTIREEFGPKEESVEVEGEESPKKKAPKKSADANEEQDKVSFLERELEKLKAERKAEKIELKTKEVYEGIKSQLSGRIKPESVNTVLKILKAEGNINIRSNGMVTFKTSDGEEISVEDGVETWLSGDEAKQFAIPVPGYGNKKVAPKPNYSFTNKGSQATTGSTTNNYAGMTKAEIAYAKMMENRSK